MPHFKERWRKHDKREVWFHCAYTYPGFPHLQDPGRCHAEDTLESHWYHWWCRLLSLPWVPVSIHWQSACCWFFFWVPNKWWLWRVGSKNSNTFKGWWCERKGSKKQYLGGLYYFHFSFPIPPLALSSASEPAYFFWYNKQLPGEMIEGWAKWKIP